MGKTGYLGPTNWLLDNRHLWNHLKAKEKQNLTFTKHCMGFQMPRNFIFCLEKMTSVTYWIEDKYSYCILFTECCDTCMINSCWFFLLRCTLVLSFFLITKVYKVFKGWLWILEKKIRHVGMTEQEGISFVAICKKGVHKNSSFGVRLCFCNKYSLNHYISLCTRAISASWPPGIP